MSPEQCRAARAWLKWSQADLADRASIGLSTVKDFESDKREPISNNLAAIQRAFEGAGVYPVFDEKGTAAGIDMRKPIQTNLGEKSGLG